MHTEGNTTDSWQSICFTRCFTAMKPHNAIPVRAVPVRSGDPSGPDSGRLKVSRPRSVLGMYRGSGRGAGVHASGLKPQVRRDMWELEHVVSRWPVGSI